MSFLHTIPPEQATGALKEIYDEQIKKLGYIPNYHKTFGLRPEVSLAWRNLQNTIRKNMRLRRFELVTLASALALKCTYCALAHAAILRRNFFDAEQLTAIVNDFRSSGLDPAEIAMMSLAEKVILDPNNIAQRDIDDLRNLGFSDEEVLDIVLAASARSFYGTVLDSLAVEPDEAYLELEPELREALVRGRPFELA